MLIYIIVFIISCLCMYFYEKNDRKNRMLLVISLLLPCVLAGLRANTVGTDVLVYVKPIYNNAILSNSFSVFYNSTYYSISSGYLFHMYEFEFGYISMVYFIEKIFHSFQLVLFFTSVLIVVPMYAGLRCYKQLSNNKRIFFSLFVFYMLIYSLSLNAMRQLIATSITFYAMSYFINSKNQKKLLIYLLLTFIAFLFHRSSLLSLFYLIIYKISRDSNKLYIIGKYKIKSNIFNSFLIVIISMIFFYIPDILLFFMSVLKNIVGKDYSGYIWTTVGFVRTTYLILPIVFLYMINYKKIEDTEYKSFLFIMLVYYFLTIQLGATTLFGSRVSLYFQFFNIVTYPLIYYSLRRRWLKCIFIIYLIVWWGYYLINGDCYPFVFFYS